VRLGIANLGLAPALDLALHRLKIPLNAIDSDRKCIDKVEALGVFGQDRRERTWDNVSKASNNRHFLQAEFWLNLLPRANILNRTRISFSSVFEALWRGLFVAVAIPGSRLTHWSVV
jgi:hypothetical protein